MRIQHNIPAMSAYRNYTNNTSALAKNLEKLSSGYQINRAGDDAAGLAISEKMRAQISGLEQAQANAKDGISLVQTAEGALTEVHDMLNRMVTLAEKSANGTYDNEVDRAQLQKELDQLRTEIDRIADSSNFNGISLLDGSMATTSAGSENVVVDGLSRIITSTIGEGEKAYDVAGVKTVFDTAVSTAAKGSFDVVLSMLKGQYVGTVKSGDTAKFDVELKVGDWSITVSATLTGLGSSVNGGSIAGSAIAQAIAKAVAAKASVVTINDMEWSVTANGSKLSFQMKTLPDTAEKAQTDFAVSVGFSNIEKYNNSTNEQVEKIQLYGSDISGTQTTKKAVAVGDSALANTVFKLTADDIKDGARITLGTTTLVLSVGVDSTVQARSGEIKVDLTDMDPDNIDLNKALSAISSKCKTFNVKYNFINSLGVRTKATVQFRLGVSDGANGQEVGLAVQRMTNVVASKTPAYFNTLERLGSVFNMTYTNRWEENDGLTLQIGDTSEDFNQLNVSINDCHVKAMGIADIDISTQAGAQEAVDKIKTAINYVSDVRGTLGATQNRLDHTINNLSVMQENIQDAESTIRDVDVAKEMMEYTKNSILVQSAQAMLAQANQLPQGVLQLLQ